MIKMDNKLQKLFNYVQSCWESYWDENVFTTTLSFLLAALGGAVWMLFR